MTSLADLRSAITQILNSPGVPAVLQLNRNRRERAFEAYVFALVLRAIRQAGGTAQLVGVKSGPNPSPIVLRGSPGHMSSTGQDFCFSRCSLNGKEFEVHLGVIYVGTSGATHELDLSLYDATKAEQVRETTGGLPTTSSLRGALECKFYDSTLGTVLGRTFVGLLADLGTLSLKVFVTNGQSSSLAKYFSKQKRPKVVFGVSPLDVAVQTRLVDVIEQELREWAGVT